ncbi:HNH endonuclease signature motif containing protein [Elizabethkingia anophelis]|uniref:HNH endonuclease signature motif containing protein n=1 Tax=Elizabethkingia anophelis TaxID=1117645 RepID=UPI00240565BE|nr:HNH endonuclease signature motif containing protein [Elizabethkingia anophelis]
MIPRKKKICKSCETEKYLFGKGLCKPCYLRLNNKQINKISQKHKELLSEYTVIRKEFLINNPICSVNQISCTKIATDIHHIKPRAFFLNDISVFMSVCRNCHDWIHSNDLEARKLGYLKSKHE